MTPGPWELDSCGWPLIVNGPGEANVVCQIDTCDELRGSRYHYPEAIAVENAKAITALPALIAALSAAYRAFDDEEDSVKREHRKVIRMMAAALRTAGVEP
jgi:hypothetical protein